MVAGIPSDSETRLTIGQLAFIIGFGLLALVAAIAHTHVVLYGTKLF